MEPMKIRVTSRPGIWALGWLIGAAAGASPAFAIDMKISSPIFGHGVVFKANGNVQPEGRIFTNVASWDFPAEGTLDILDPSGNAVASFANNDLFLKGTTKTSQSSFPGRSQFKKADGTLMASVDDAGNLYMQGSVESISLCAATVTELSKWNTSTSIQSYDNCYNYGNNQATYTFAQPGKATGATASDMTVTLVRQAALNDGLTWVGWNFPGNTYTCANSGTLVFMTVAPHVDYHWYRLDKANGKWTHKPGGSPATDVDASGNTITNPLVANRNYGALNYTDNGGFYCTCGGDANVR
jgi:hypothetical protein